MSWATSKTLSTCGSSIRRNSVLVRFDQGPANPVRGKLNTSVAVDEVASPDETTIGTPSSTKSATESGGTDPLRDQSLARPGSDRTTTWTSANLRSFRATAKSHGASPSTQAG